VTGFQTITLSASTLAVLGKGALAVCRFMPAPAAGSVFYRWFFDVVQDLASNNDRVGMVRVTQPPEISQENKL
jgi:hypothetical protein